MHGSGAPGPFLNVTSGNAGAVVAVTRHDGTRASFENFEIPWDVDVNAVLARLYERQEVTFSGPLGGSGDVGERGLILESCLPSWRLLKTLLSRGRTGLYGWRTGPWSKVQGSRFCIHEKFSLFKGFLSPPVPSVGQLEPELEEPKAPRRASLPASSCSLWRFLARAA